ncbi:MAG: SMC-Scp complex subunit ScpB, partial [Alphaproteobacteria bacterium]|nr:SMC-Scp complex subunit ScpB [Alphaproteobacteria bacterium]
MDRFQQIRLLEAMLFASAEPLSERVLAARLPEAAEVDELLKELVDHYANRGVHLVQVGNRWAFRSAPDLAEHLRLETKIKRRLSRAAQETMAIIAYHQPITRAEIEEMRGVSLSRGTLDILLEAGWIRPRGRRRVPGRPVTWGTTDTFLDHFGLADIDDLPGVEELKAAGLLDRDGGLGLLALPLEGGGEDVDDDAEDLDGDDSEGSLVEGALADEAMAEEAADDG